MPRSFQDGLCAVRTCGWVLDNILGKIVREMRLLLTIIFGDASNTQSCT